MVSSISSNSNDLLAYLLKRSASSSTTSTNPLNAGNMFAKLSKELGGDGKTITKSQLENYINSIESNTTSTQDKGKLGFLKQLDTNWDKISGGSDSITESQFSAGLSYLQPPTNGSNSLSSDLFTSLLEAVGKDSNSSSSISKDDLVSYLKSLVSFLNSNSSTTTDNDSDGASTSGTTNTDNTGSTSGASDANIAREIKFITNLISNFGSFADSSGNITSNSFYSALKEPQDPSTITSEQLASPIDIKI